MSMLKLLCKIEEKSAPIAVDLGNAILNVSSDSVPESFERIKCIINATVGKCAAFYLDISAFESSPAAHPFLTKVLSYAKEKGAYIILDFKALTYSQEIKRCFEKESLCDAVTACPYLGEEFIQPFVFAANKLSKSVFLYLNPSDSMGFGEFSDMILRLSGQALGAARYSNIGVFLTNADSGEAAKVRNKLPGCMILKKVSKINTDIINCFSDDGSGALPIISLLRQDKEFDFENLYVDSRRETERNIRALNKTVFRKSKIIQI